MNRLQRLRSEKQYFVSLNLDDRVPEEQRINTTVFTHPIYTFDSLATQPRLTQLNGANRTYFCGAYWGYGFHEDGANSALAVAQHFGIELDACTVVSTKESSRIVVTSR